MEYIIATCSIEGCGNEYKTRKEGGNELCPACRSSQYYWRKRRPAQILFRRGRLTVWGNRLDFWYTKEGKKR